MRPFNRHGAPWPRRSRPTHNPGHKPGAHRRFQLVERKILRREGVEEINAQVADLLEEERFQQNVELIWKNTYRQDQRLNDFYDFLPWYDDAFPLEPEPYDDEFMRPLDQYYDWFEPKPCDPEWVHLWLNGSVSVEYDFDYSSPGFNQLNLEAELDEYFNETDSYDWTGIKDWCRDWIQWHVAHYCAPLRADADRNKERLKAGSRVKWW